MMSPPGQLPPLPEPDPQALALSQVLSEQIHRAIANQGGQLPFDRYMELALYAPGLGYYSNDLRKFGIGGDFITAPEMTPLFGLCLANQCAETLSALGGGDILEIGAGSGRLATDLLSGLMVQGCLPDRYLILELSASLRQRQQALLRQDHPGLYHRIQWLDQLPDAFSGLIIANEVLDAMPVSRFRYVQDQFLEGYVSLQGQQLVHSWEPIHTPGLAEACQARLDRYALTEDYESEINLRLGPWLAALSNSLDRGLALLIDYGHNGSEFFHPQRQCGTLICHYHHHLIHDPLTRPGLQDITANVDFTAVAEEGQWHGFEQHAFCSQGQFLTALGLDQLLTQRQEQLPATAYAQELQAAKRLLMPHEMGERFKVLGLGKGLDSLPKGFQLGNLRL